MNNGQNTYIRLGVAISIMLFSNIFTDCASARPIYVYQEPDGSKKFSNVPPPTGINAQIFTARKSSFSWYRQPPRYGGPSLVKLYANTFNQNINDAANEHGLDKALIKAVIHAESGFNQFAVSAKGALGLMQLMPSTAKDLGVSNSFSAEQNIKGGAKYLRQLLDRYNGNLTKAIAAYNAGMDWVDKYKGIPPFEETQKYVKIVTALQDRYRSRG